MTERNLKFLKEVDWLAFCFGATTVDSTEGLLTLVERINGERDDFGTREIRFHWPMRLIVSDEKSRLYSINGALHYNSLRDTHSPFFDEKYSRRFTGRDLDPPYDFRSESDIHEVKLQDGEYVRKYGPNVGLYYRYEMCVLPVGKTIHTPNESFTIVDKSIRSVLEYGKYITTEWTSLVCGPYIDQYWGLDYTEFYDGAEDERIKSGKMFGLQ